MNIGYIYIAKITKPYTKCKQFPYLIKQKDHHKHAYAYAYAYKHTERVLLWQIILDSHMKMCLPCYLRSLANTPLMHFSCAQTLNEFR